MENEIALVNERDELIGVANKPEVHKKGLLHRAFSVFIFNSKGEMLLQQRVINKYHSGGLWSNACCSHPRPEEDILYAASRRLKEEMGFETPLEKVFDFIYKAELKNGLTEHEFDHVFTGEYDGRVTYNKKEVMDYSYKSMDELRDLLQQQSSQFTAWFQIVFPRINNWWKDHYQNV